MTQGSPCGATPALQCGAFPGLKANRAPRWAPGCRT